MISRYRADPRRVEGKISLVDILGEMQDRLKANDTSLRIGNTTIEDGELLVRNGDIVVGETDGTEVMRLYHGEYPRIHFTPMGADADWTGILFSQELDDAVYMEMGVYRNEDPLYPAEGGKIALGRGYTILSYHPAYSGGEEIYIWFHPYGDFSGFEEVIAMRGQYPQNTDYDSHQAHVAGTFDMSAGFGGANWSYSNTFPTVIAPIIGLVNTAGLVTSWNLTAMSTTGWTVSWSGLLAKTVNWWAPRMSG